MSYGLKYVHGASVDSQRDVAIFAEPCCLEGHPGGLLTGGYDGELHLIDCSCPPQPSCGRRRSSRRLSTLSLKGIKAHVPCALFSCSVVYIEPFAARLLEAIVAVGTSTGVVFVGVKKENGCHHRDDMCFDAASAPSNTTSTPYEGLGSRRRDNEDVAMSDSPDDSDAAVRGDAAVDTCWDFEQKGGAIPTEQTAADAAQQMPFHHKRTESMILSASVGSSCSEVSSSSRRSSVSCSSSQTSSSQSCERLEEEDLKRLKSTRGEYEDPSLMERQGVEDSVRLPRLALLDVTISSEVPTLRRVSSVTALAWLPTDDDRFHGMRLLAAGRRDGVVDVFEVDWRSTLDVAERNHPCCSASPAPICARVIRSYTNLSVGIVAVTALIAMIPYMFLAGLSDGSVHVVDVRCADNTVAIVHDELGQEAFAPINPVMHLDASLRDSSEGSRLARATSVVKRLYRTAESALRGHSTFGAAEGFSKAPAGHEDARRSQHAFSARCVRSISWVALAEDPSRVAGMVSVARGDGLVRLLHVRLSRLCNVAATQAYEMSSYPFRKHLSAARFLLSSLPATQPNNCQVWLSVAFVKDVVKIFRVPLDAARWFICPIESVNALSSTESSAKVHSTMHDKEHAERACQRCLRRAEVVVRDLHCRSTSICTAAVVRCDSERWCIVRGGADAMVSSFVVAAVPSA